MLPCAKRPLCCLVAALLALQINGSLACVCAQWRRLCAEDCVQRKAAEAFLCSSVHASGRIALARPRTQLQHSKCALSYATTHCFSASASLCLSHKTQVSLAASSSGKLETFGTIGSCTRAKLSFGFSLLRLTNFRHKRPPPTPRGRPTVSAALVWPNGWPTGEPNGELVAPQWTSIKRAPRGWQTSIGRAKTQ